MKHAIGKITFLRVPFGMGLCPGMFKPCTTAESPSKVSHEVCNWQNCFYVLRTGALGSWAVRERLLRGLSQAHAEGPRSKLAMKDSIG